MSSEEEAAPSTQPMLIHFEILDISCSVGVLGPSFAAAVSTTPWEPRVAARGERRGTLGQTHVARKYTSPTTWVGFSVPPGWNFPALICWFFPPIESQNWSSALKNWRTIAKNKLTKCAEAERILTFGIMTEKMEVWKRRRFENFRHNFLEKIWMQKR